MKNVKKSEALIFKAFCDESRLYIIELLRGGEKCACTLLEQLTISQSTLSHHMKILQESGVIHGRKEGKWIYYSLCPEGCESVKGLLAGLLTVATDATSTCRCDF